MPRLQESTIESFISQYRGELSALRAYEEALLKYKGQPEAPALAELHREHVDAVERLGAVILDNDHTLPADAGAWGTLVATAKRLVSMFNDALPLQALRQGEAHGAEGYAELMEAPGVDDALYAELAALRSRCNRHVEILDDLIDKVPERPTRPMLGREVPDDDANPDPLPR